MSEFTESVAQDLIDLFGTAGELHDDVTYTDSGGNASTVAVVLMPERTGKEFSDRGENHISSRMVYAHTDSGGIASPKPKETLTIDGEVWEISPAGEIAVSGYGYVSFYIRRLLNPVKVHANQVRDK